MDAAERKTILRMIPYGLYVVTSRRGDEVNAFTASWLTQCSFKPPLLALGVNRQHRSHEMIREGGAFAVNFLGKDQQAVALHFLKPWRDMGAKLEGIGLRSSPSGVPLLDNALAYVECRVVECSEHGDHALFIGEIVDGQVLRSGEPLIMSDTPWHYGG